MYVYIYTTCVFTQQGVEGALSEVRCHGCAAAGARGHDVACGCEQARLSPSGTPSCSATRRLVDIFEGYFGFLDVQGSIYQENRSTYPQKKLIHPQKRSMFAGELLHIRKRAMYIRK